MAKFEIPTIELPIEATRPLYAGVGATDVVVGYVRDAVADLQKKFADVQKDVQTRVTSIDLEPKALRDQAVVVVSAQIDALSKDAKARREAIEARVAELQADARTVAGHRELGVRRPRQARRDPGRPDPHAGVDEGDHHRREDHDRQGEDHQDPGHQGCEEDHHDRQEGDEVDGQEGHLDGEEDLDRSEEQREGDRHRREEDRRERCRGDDRRCREDRRLNEQPRAADSGR